MAKFTLVAVARIAATATIITFAGLWGTRVGIAASYCQDAQAMSHNYPSYQELSAKLMARCQPGDTLVLDGVPQTIGIVCDFNKPIAKVGNSTVCVMAAQSRQVR